MFNDRDLYLLGVGAVLAVLSLLLPFPLLGKVACGLSGLAVFMVLALLRLGPDRVTPEEWLRRRMRYKLAARRYLYQCTLPIQPAQPTIPRVTSLTAALRAGWVALLDWVRMPPELARPGDLANVSEASAVQLSGQPHAPSPAAPTPAHFPQLSLAFDEVRVHPLAAAFLVVIGIHLIAWIIQDGAPHLIQLFQRWG